MFLKGGRGIVFEELPPSLDRCTIAYKEKDNDVTGS
jgi:hypothetical protein